MVLMKIYLGGFKMAHLILVWKTYIKVTEHLLLRFGFVKRCIVIDGFNCCLFLELLAPHDMLLILSEGCLKGPITKLQGSHRRVGVISSTTSGSVEREPSIISTVFSAFTWGPAGEESALRPMPGNTEANGKVRKTPNNAESRASNDIHPNSDRILSEHLQAVM